MNLVGKSVSAPALQRLLIRVSGSRGVSDDDLVFFMPVYRDEDVAYRSLTRIRRIYPGSRIVLLSDGDDRFPSDSIVQRFGVEFVFGENLYGMERGGETLHRMLDQYMLAPARFLVRLDTDARVDRRFRYLPRQDGAFGRIGRRSRTLQGGCVIFSHGAASRLFSSRIFLSQRLLDPAASWGRYSTPANLERKLAQKRIAYDKVLHWGCVEQKVPILEFGEVYSVWKPAPEYAACLANKDLRAAIVHPDKMEGEGSPYGSHPA